MPPIQIMIVDDSLVVRKVLINVLSTDPDLAIAGWASNGRLALAKLQTLRPDIILLDIEMPEMNGLETIPGIRKILPHTPIIMFSTLTERGAEATLDALALGASDYVAKPSNQNMAATSEAIHRDLVPKIKALCHFPVRAQISRDGCCKPDFLHSSARDSPARSFSALCPAQDYCHRSIDRRPGRTRQTPAFYSPRISLCPWSSFSTCRQSLRRFWRNGWPARCALPVRECQPGDLLAPSCIWVAPGDYHMVVQEEDHRVRLQTHQGPRENFCRPSVDVLFRSVAAVYGASALGVILTGMGQDGLKGCEALCAAGASVIVQDEASSVVWGMPGFVARAGLAEKILPLDQIAIEIVRRVTARPLLQLTH